MVRLPAYWVFKATDEWYADLDLGVRYTKSLYPSAIYRAATRGDQASLLPGSERSS